MNGEYTLTVVTDTKNLGNVNYLCLKDSQTELFAASDEKEIDEVYKKIGIRKGGSDFFVVVNYICRDFGLKFVSYRENASPISRYLVKSALLEGKC